MSWMPVITVLNAAAATAAGAAHDAADHAATAAHEAGQGGLWGLLLQSNLINFLIALVIIIVLFRKFDVVGRMRRGRAGIQAEIEALETSRKNAEQELLALKQRTAKLNEEVTTILEQAQLSAEAMARQIVDNARTDADKLIEASKKRIEMEQRSAANALERRLLSDAMQDARLELAQNVNAEDQKRSVEAFISELKQAR